MGYPDDKPKWTRSIGRTTVFDDSYIPTVILDSESREFFVSGNDTWTLGRFTIVLKDEIYTEENVPSKAQNRYEDKFQWRIKLEKKLHKRKVFKFRANPNDPTFYRQSLYADVLRTIGNPVHNQIIVRAYLYDGTPLGLYLMIEVTASNSFIKTQFYGNQETRKVIIPSTGLGYTLDCGMGSDFVPGGSLASFKANAGENSERIKYLSDAIAALDVTDQKAVEQFNKEWFDINIFLKAMAMEYLTAHWDSYWMFETNFVMYDAPEESSNGKFKFYFLDQDFDLTFGLDIPSQINTVGADFPTQSYKELVNANLKINDRVKEYRVLIDKFLKGGVTVQMFENHLTEIVKHVFNPVALGRRLEEYDRRYASEVEWDYGLERLHIGGDPNKTRHIWTYNDYVENLDSTPKKNAPWGLKQWIEMRAQAVANEFNFEWDSVPLEPKEKDPSVDSKEKLKGSKSFALPSIKVNSINFIIIGLTSLIFGIFM